MTNMTGTIKRLVSDKGFGFVAASDGNEYFFHHSGCRGVIGKISMTAILICS